jgi:hypothetical protein
MDRVPGAKTLGAISAGKIDLPISDNAGTTRSCDRRLLHAVTACGGAGKCHCVSIFRE